MEDLKCEFIGYKVTGISFLKTWDGTSGCIEMDPTLVEKEEDINSAINDAGFGCERIEYALIRVFAQYQYNALKFLYEKFVNLSNPLKEVPKEIQNKMTDMMVY